MCGGLNIHDLLLTFEMQPKYEHSCERDLFAMIKVNTHSKEILNQQYHISYSHISYPYQPIGNIFIQVVFL